MNLQFFGGRGSSSGKGKASNGGNTIEKKTSVNNASKVEPLDKNSSVSKFMDKILAKPDTQWTRIAKKEDSDFIYYAESILDTYKHGLRQALITTFQSAASEQNIAEAIEGINKILASSATTPAYKEAARQWKNYLENYKK